MTKFYPAPPQKKAKPLPTSFKQDEMCPAITSELLQPFAECDSVVFTLTTGHKLYAKVEGLEDDSTVIYGNMPNGAAFALPIASVLYCAEVR